MSQPAMTAAEIGEVVALAASGDPYMTAEKMTAERIQLWMYAILTEAPEMTLDEARRTIGHYYARVGKSMQIGDLIRGWEDQAGKAQSAAELARDVRLARRFGLVDRDWHEKKQLPAEVVGKLDTWRAEQAAEREQINREIADAEDGKRLALDVGRRV